MTDDPISKIEKMMRDRGWGRRHLYPAMGGCAKVSEVMNRKRPLTLSMIRCLVFNYGMRAEDIIAWYPTESQPNEPGGALFQAFRDVENSK